MSRMNAERRPTKKGSSFPWYAAAAWERIPHLIHGFSGRLSDQAAALSVLSASELPLHTLTQVHGNALRVVGPDTSVEGRPQADGMLSATAGQLLGIVTADCVPVLMVAPRQRVVAALHAGWRGTAKDICGRAIRVLKTDWGVSPADLLVALGPSIGGCCYEVGRDIGENLCRQVGTRGRLAWRQEGNVSTSQHVSDDTSPLEGTRDTKSDHKETTLACGDTGFLDLRLVNRLRCEQLGVPPQHIQHVGPCTFCSGAALSSYRRDGARAGRQLSVIGWDGE